MISTFNITFSTDTVWLKGENIDVDPNSFDFVIGTHVLCSVQSVKDVLKQVSRVLKVGGKYIFFEHTVSEESSLLWYQNLLAPLLFRVGAGCTFRPLWLFLSSAEPYGLLSDFNVSLHKFNLETAGLFFIRPHVKGTALKQK